MMKNAGVALKKSTVVLLIVIAVVFIIAGTFAGWVYYWFFMPNNKVVPAFPQEGVNLVIEGEVVNGAQPVVEENEIMLPINVVKEFIDPYIYWDKNLKKITVTTKDRVVRMKSGSLDALINNKPIKLDFPVTINDGTAYIPIKFLSDFYKISINYIRDTNAVVIDSTLKTVDTVQVISRKAVIRTGRSVRYPIIRKYKTEAGPGADTTLKVFGQYEDWYKVRTSKGEVGYIEKKYTVFTPAKPGDDTETQEEKVWKPGKGHISLAWDQIWTAKKVDLSGLEDVKGLDVISPTWLQLASAEGKLTNRSDPAYVKWAHNRGFKVWSVLNNDFGNTKMTSAFLSNTDSRDNLIKELLAYSALYKLDGINIDFESLDASDKGNLTQFVRELVPFLKEQGLVVSIDINDHACYDRKALGEAVDYVAIMAYDQHWKGSTKAGSVAQVKWVEGMIQRYLSDIPAEKILLGVPFYTRLWKEEPQADGAIKLSNQAISMETARKVIGDNNAPVRWDDESGQFYSEFTKDGSVYKVWLEDKNSINVKLSLVHKYKLAGAAAWSINFAEDGIWDVLGDNLKRITSYEEWKSKNTAVQYVYGK